MFDIGFPELVVISIIALLVIGPKKLPETIRTISLWVGRLQRSFTNIRRELENEIGADEIRAQLHNESIMKDLEETKNTIQSVRQEVRNTVNTVGTEARELASGTSESKTDPKDSESGTS